MLTIAVLTISTGVTYLELARYFLDPTYILFHLDDMFKKHNRKNHVNNAENVIPSIFIRINKIYFLCTNTHCANLARFLPSIYYHFSRLCRISDDILLISTDITQATRLGVNNYILRPHKSKIVIDQYLFTSFGRRK